MPHADPADPPAGHCQNYAVSVSSAMKFEWDQAKHDKTLRERGLGFDDAARIFARPVLIWEDPAAITVKIASGRWARAMATFSTWRSHGAAMCCG
jgi:uncharacterized DUF497 family protein